MSRFGKFKRGDRIKTTYGSIGKILDVFKENGIQKYHVESDSGMRSDYKEDELKFHHADIESGSPVSAEHIGDKCPKCSTPWTITRFGAKNWKDCTPCGKTAEDLLDNNTKWSKKDVDNDLDAWYDVLRDWGSD